MDTEKTEREKAAKVLLDKAADCLEIADSQQFLADKLHEVSAGQRANADQQHQLAARQDFNADRLDANVKKLKTLGHALEGKAAETQGDTEVVQRSRP